MLELLLSCKIKGVLYSDIKRHNLQIRGNSGFVPFGKNKTGGSKKMRKMLLNIRDRMFKLSEDEPLSPLSILVLIFLDIFLLTVLFQGLDAQSRLLTSPDDYVSEICQEIIIDKEWNENNRLDKLSDIVVMEHRSTYNQSSRPKNIYPICKDVINSLNQVKTEKFIINLFEDRDRLISLQKENRFCH
jgi:hypothetical protein